MDASSSDGNVTSDPSNSSAANAGSDAAGVSGQFQGIINPQEPSNHPLRISAPTILPIIVAWAMLYLIALT